MREGIPQLLSDFVIDRWEFFAAAVLLSALSLDN